MAAAHARLAGPAVDAELGLHRSRRAVASAVVAERRSLAGNAEPERPPNSSHQGLELLRRERVGGTQRVEPCPPERLVRVDVPDACEDALVEDDGLERRSAARQTVGQRAGGEAAAERLLADPLREVRLELARLEEQPRAETPDVSIRDVRSVV